MKSLIWHMLPKHSSSQTEVRAGTQDRNLEAGTEVQASEKGSFHWLALSASLYHPGAPAQWWHHPQWTGPSHINHQVRKCPRSILMEGGGILLVEVDKTELHSRASRPAWSVRFLTETPFSGASSLCQVDGKAN